MDKTRNPTTWKPYRPRASIAADLTNKDNDASYIGSAQITVRLGVQRKIEKAPGLLSLLVLILRIVLNPSEEEINRQGNERQSGERVY